MTVFCCDAYVRLWHKADLARRLPFVRFRGEADRHARVASTASVVNDPSGHGPDRNPAVQRSPTREATLRLQAMY
jgi:hypothetical protein